MAKVTGNNQAVSIMRKYAFTLMALAAMFGLSSCDKELVPAEDFNNNNKKYVIYASTEDSRTKTSISGNDAEGYQVFWSEGDQFYVYHLVQVKEPFSTMPVQKLQRVEGPFELISGAGTTSGTFERDGDALPNLTLMALYPDFPEAFPINNYLNDFYPTEQTYSKGNIKGFPMLAQIVVNNGEITGPISFKNMNGILRLTVKGTATVKSIKVSAVELPTPITLDCGDGVELTPEGIDFHIAMLTGTFTGVEIALTDTEGKTCTKKFKGTDGLVVERSMITKASFTASDFKSAVTYNKGDKVTLDGHDGIVVDIDGTLVAVATMNVGATSVNEDGCLGPKMTYDDACAAWSGWRLPTVDEFTAFCAPWYPACGDTYGVEGGTGAVMWDIDGDEEIDLYLPLNDNDEDGNPSDIYWTGTPGSDGTYYYFAPAIEFDGDYAPLVPEYIRKEEAAIDSEFLVRLFHDLP